MSDLNNITQRNQDETPDINNLMFLMDIYQQDRHAMQLNFYEKRKQENERNSGCTFVFSTLFMGLAGLAASLNISSGTPLWYLVATILPAFASLLNSFNQIYDWERQTNLYRDAIKGLRKMPLQYDDLKDDLGKIDLANSYEALAHWMQDAEKVLSAEADQWGQLTPGVGTAPPSSSTASSPSNP